MKPAGVTWPGARTGTRRAATLGGAGLAVLAMSIAVAVPARAELLGPHNSRVLAESLAAASQQQGICYGWDVQLDSNYAPVPSSHEMGSNRGVGVDPRRAAGCDRWVMASFGITYTSQDSESEDAASFSLQSSDDLGVDTGDLRRIGITEDKLLGERDVRTIYNAVAALPQLVAEAGEGQAPRAQQPANFQLPENARLAGSPGSDYLRNYGVLIVICAVVLAVGVGWLVYALRRARRS